MKAENLHLSGLGPDLRRGAQRGFTIVELLIVLSVSALLATSYFIAQRFENRKAASQLMGTSFQPYAQAGQDYVLKKKDELIAGTAITGVAIPLRPTVTELRAIGILPAALPLTLASNGGTPTYLITRIPSGCVTTACDLEYLVRNSTPELNSDGTVNEGLLSGAAATIGATAGYSTIATPATLQGKGGWTYANPAGSVAGIFAVYNTYSQSNNNAFVRIGDSRDPALLGNLTVAGTVTAGTLTAASVQASSLIVAGAASVGQLNLTGTVIAGAACSPDGGVSKDASGALLTCRGAVWSTLSSCLPFSGDLNTLETTGCFNGSSLTNTPGGSAEWFFVEVIRHYNTTNFFATQRATGMTGASANGVWTRAQQSATINTGWGAWTQSVTADSSGTVAISNLQLVGTVPTGTSCTVASGSSSVRAISGGGLATCVGGLWAAVVPTATPGAACTLNGVQYASNVDGRMLVCRNGINMQVNDLFSNFVLMQTYRVVNGSIISKPTCGQLGMTTGTPLGILTGASESSADASFYRRLFDVAGNNWQVALFDNTGQALGSSILSAYCYY